MKKRIDVELTRNKKKLSSGKEKNEKKETLDKKELFDVVIIHKFI